MGVPKQFGGPGEVPLPLPHPLPTSWWACLEPCNVSGTMKYITDLDNKHNICLIISFYLGQCLCPLSSCLVPVSVVSVNWSR